MDGRAPRGRDSGWARLHVREVEFGKRLAGWGLGGNTRRHHAATGRNLGRNACGQGIEGRLDLITVGDASGVDVYYDTLCSSRCVLCSVRELCMIHGMIPFWSTIL